MADPLEQRPGPCPVCGLLDCARYDHDGMRVLFAEWSDDPPPRPAKTVAAPEDLWEDVPVPRSTRTRRRLVARAGQQVDAETARRFGIMPEGQPAKDQRPSDEVAKPEARKVPPPKPARERDRDQQPGSPRDRAERK